MLGLDAAHLSRNAWLAGVSSFQGGKAQRQRAQVVASAVVGFTPLLYGA